MNQNVKFIILLVISGLISSSAFFFFPEVNDAGLGYIIAIAFGASVTQLLAVWYFLSSLRTFKRGLRTAYYWVSAGIFLFSLLLLVPSLSTFMPVLQSNIQVNNVLVIAPFVSGTFCMYMGMRRFVGLLGSKYRLGSFWIALAFSAVVAGIVVLLPHPPTLESERMFDLTFASIAWCGAFGTVATLVALHIRRIIGPIYRTPMLWAALAMLVLTIASLQELISKIYFLDSTYVTAQYSLAWFLLVGIMFMRAGVAFKETGRESLRLPAKASYVDVVTSTAQLVSKPDEIDKVLDDVRMVTAHQSSEAQEVGPEDKKKLVRVYLAIEDYLVNREPLHKFTQEKLRNSLPDEFARELTTS